MVTMLGSHDVQEDELIAISDQVIMNHSSRHVQLIKECTRHNVSRDPEAVSVIDAVTLEQTNRIINIEGPFKSPENVFLYDLQT